MRSILAGVLRGVISQRLLPRLGGGRVAAVEVMVNTARVADLIREPDKTEGITEALEDGGFHDMQSFSQHLVQLVLDELVDLETAANAATNRHDFEITVERALREKRVAEGGATPPAEAPGEPEPEPERVEAQAEVTLPGLRLSS